MRLNSSTRAALAILAGLFLAALYTYFRAGLATDDMYITYRYAENLAEGRGLVFNPNERVFGVTDPGVAVLLAALRITTRAPLPVLGSALHAAALFVLAFVIARAARARDRGPEGLAAGALILTSPFLWAAQGSGPPVALALLLSAAAVASQRPLLAGLLGGLGVLCRADTLAGVTLLGLLLVFERRAADEAAEPRRSRGLWRFALGAMAPVALGAAAAWAWFGTVLPNTLAAKRAYAASDVALHSGFAPFARSTFRLLARPLVLESPAGWGDVARGVTLFALGLGVLGWLATLRLRTPQASEARRPSDCVFTLLALFALTIAVVYPLLGVPYFLWYVIPPVVALLVGAPFAVGFVARSTNASRPLAILLALPLAAMLVASFASLDSTGENDWRRTAYTAAGRWLRAHATPEADVAAEEIGYLGYESGRPISDLVGLVTPRAIPFAQDRLGAFLAHPTEYVIFHTYNARGGTRPIVQHPWFHDAYAEVACFPTDRRDDGSPYLAIYQRVSGAKIPPPRPPRR